MPPTSEKLGCACPSADARRCIEIRYPTPPLEDDDGFGPDDDEKCGCVCHEPDPDEPDWWDDEPGRV